MVENAAYNPINERFSELFLDARQMQPLAIERLEAGDVRDAAGKAWCATQRATSAFILACTGDEPESTMATSDALDALTRHDHSRGPLKGGYYSRIYHLRDMCFYHGLCNEGTAGYIRETAGYVDEVDEMIR